MAAACTGSTAPAPSASPILMPSAATQAALLLSVGRVTLCDMPKPFWLVMQFLSLRDLGRLLRINRRWRELASQDAPWREYVGTTLLIVSSLLPRPCKDVYLWLRNDWMEAGLAPLWGTYSFLGASSDDSLFQGPRPTYLIRSATVDIMPGGQIGRRKPVVPPRKIVVGGGGGGGGESPLPQNIPTPRTSAGVAVASSLSSHPSRTAIGSASSPSPVASSAGVPLPVCRVVISVVYGAESTKETVSGFMQYDVDRKSFRVKTFGGATTIAGPCFSCIATNANRPWGNESPVAFGKHQGGVRLIFTLTSPPAARGTVNSRAVAWPNEVLAVTRPPVAPSTIGVGAMPAATRVDPAAAGAADHASTAAFQGRSGARSSSPKKASFSSPPSAKRLFASLFSP